MEFMRYIAEIDIHYNGNYYTTCTKKIILADFSHLHAKFTMTHV